jgi:hypothetical protein
VEFRNVEYFHEVDDTTCFGNLLGPSTSIGNTVSTTNIYLLFRGSGNFVQSSCTYVCRPNFTTPASTKRQELSLLWMSTVSHRRTLFIRCGEECIGKLERFKGTPNWWVYVYERY